MDNSIILAAITAVITMLVDSILGTLLTEPVKHWVRSIINRRQSDDKHDAEVSVNTSGKHVSVKLTNLDDNTTVSIRKEGDKVDVHVHTKVTEPSDS